MNINKIIIFWGILLSLGYTQHTQAQTDLCPSPGPYYPDDPNHIWDFQMEFSPWELNLTMAQNPYRDWSYGRGENLTDFLLNDVPMFQEEYPRIRWIPGEGVILPHVWRNFGPRVHGTETCEVAMHPAEPSESHPLAKVRWTSPLNATIDIIGVFKEGHAGNVDVWIIKDGQAVSPLFEVLGTFVDTPFDISTEVVIGTTIDFVLGPAGNYGSDTVPLHVQIGRNLQLQCRDISERLPYDFNRDCYVNLEDLALFIGSWLDCNDPSNTLCLD